MKVTPTPEQQAAIDCTDNAVITACPGSGKTFTLARMIARESADLLSYQGIIAISYTNKASDELMARCDRLGVKRMCSFFGTIDSFCVSQLVVPFIPQLVGASADLELVEDEVCKEWGRLKGRGVDDDELKQFIRQELECGRLPIGALGAAALFILDEIEQASVFVKARYTSVFIDEYQDCGYYQHQLFMRFVSYGLRGVVVGDIDQAIFRFADKSPEYLSKLMESDDFRHFEISENHRCDKAIHDYSRALLGVPSLSIAREDRRVFEIHLLGDERTIAVSIRNYLRRIMDKYKVDDPCSVAIIGSANHTLDIIRDFICIPNKRYLSTPLDKGISQWRSIFIELLRCYYDSSRFAGAFLDKHLGVDARPSKRNRCFELVDEFFSLNEAELGDRIDLAVAIAMICEPDSEQVGDVDAYRETVNDLAVLQNGYRPAQPGEVNILTYHKAKGLEFDITFCLEAYKYIMPPFKSEEGGDDGEYAQSLAMHYVGITRAKKACYILLGTERHNSNGELKRAIPSEFLARNNTSELRNKYEW